MAFFGVDSTRADLEFVRVAYESAVEAGAQEVVVVDTLGIATPEAAAFLVGEVAERLDTRCPSTGTATTTSASRPPQRSRPSRPHGDLGAGDGERHGGAGGKRRPRRGRSRARGAVRDPRRLSLERVSELAGLVQRLRDTARAVEGGDGRQPLHAGVGRGRRAVPRPACDRAVLVEQIGAERGIVLGKKTRDRLDPDQGRGGSASTCPRGAIRSCSRRSSGSE